MLELILVHCWYMLVFIDICWNLFYFTAGIPTYTSWYFLYQLGFIGIMKNYFQARARISINFRRNLNFFVKIQEILSHNMLQII